MDTELDLSGVKVEVVRKNIKNVHLSVNPPDGRVRISAPDSMGLDAIRVFALSKLLWIRDQQKKIKQQVRETPREFLERESHWVWGKRYLLDLIESSDTQKVELTPGKLVVFVRPNSTKEQIKEVLDGWYREQIRDAVRPIIERWSKVLDVKVEKVFVQRMKTKWGGCEAENGSLRLNTALAQKPSEFLEYVVLHELTHLIEPNHGERFQRIMDNHVPNWRHIRDELNRLPVPFGEWN